MKSIRFLFESPEELEYTLRSPADPGSQSGHGRAIQVTDPTRLPFGTPARGRAGSSPSEETVDVTRSWAYEVAVIGGGPGGASTAAALARKGHRVLLLERETFPRFHIGGSQLPRRAEG